MKTIKRALNECKTVLCWLWLDARKAPPSTVAILMVHVGNICLLAALFCLFSAGFFLGQGDWRLTGASLGAVPLNLFCYFCERWKTR